MACESRMCYVLGIMLSTIGLVLTGYGLHLFVKGIDVDRSMPAAINTSIEKAAVNKFQMSLKEPPIVSREIKIVRRMPSDDFMTSTHLVDKVPHGHLVASTITFSEAHRDAVASKRYTTQLYSNNAKSEGLCNGVPARREITFINREDGSVNFQRGWIDYKQGFGHQDGEFWLGLDCLHNITNSKQYKLRVNFGDFEGNAFQSRYNNFYVGPESEGYKLHVSGYDRSSSGGDSLINTKSPHNNMKFSTIDRDNDRNSGNCAETYTGGWWYNVCHRAHPTGVYLDGGQLDWNGINWALAKRNYYSFKCMKLTLVAKA